ncbi:BatD family protein [Flavobacterium pallidum]|uniref:BatD protein n=1 Tax=Flavobacterium pallidum TaxID=2172098 RepID=A0A2S1SL81_9FLAO|nr:BatD family protein [Flavobacterium pallidum]AWI27160.1 BatD protein [Flavobacterium pallidum]
MKKLIFLLLIAFQGLSAQVQFEAKASKTTLGLNERLRVDFSMNDDGDNFVPPAFEGFKVIAGPSQQVSQSWINGKMSFNKTYSYFLLPTQKGTLTIKQASIEIRRQVYKTTPIKINVTNAVEMPKDPNDTSISADDAIHLVADVSKGNPYINEPITVVYKLYISYNIGLSNFKELDKPKYNDFWSQNIEIKELKAEDATYNGERVRCVVLKKVVLYPQKSGKLTIEPLSLDLDVQVPTNRRNFWGQALIKEDNKRVSAGARTINVKPLPDAGKPEDFTGAVGRFDFKVVPSKTELKNGESLELNVSVSGNGNLKLFNLPKPVVPTALEMYDPVHKEQVSTPLSGMAGKISDNYTIIPQYKGDYLIKPMTFSYYDLSSGKYRTIVSKEIKIKVLDGPSPSEGSTASNDGPGKQEISKTDHFEFIKLKTNLEPIHKKDFLGSNLFYGLLMAPFLCIPLLIGIRRKKHAIDADVVGNKTKMSNKLAKKFLSEAKKHLDHKEPFYIALEKALHNFMKAKTQIETSEMSKDKIREILLARNASPETVTDFITLTENCEFARYAPASSVTIHNDYDKAVAIISALEKQI